MGADALLSRLEGVRQRGPSQWSAQCPAHDDRAPSLSIRELDDGRTLLHCFGGCDVELIVGACGLSLTDLFPPRQSIPAGGASPERRRRMASAGQMLEVLACESLLTWTAAHNLANGHALTPADLKRLDVAARRIQDFAAEVRA
jgi:hypothetical protein